MCSRRSPFRVTTSYAEHFHLVSVHVQKLDFHDECVRLSAVWRIRRLRMEEQPSDMEVKFTFVQALRLCTGRTAHRSSRGIALPILDHGTKRGWEVSVTPRPLFTPGKDPVPIVQETGCASDMEGSYENIK